MNCRVSSEQGSALANDGEGILVPGRTCWRVGQASRFAVALHARAQRLALRQALLGATQTVFIVGWHIDSQTLLAGPEDDAWPQRLGDLLQALLLRRPALHVYVLAWDFCMLYSARLEWPPVYRQAWPKHRRLVHRLDARHPAGSAHHQNFVVVDDVLAFIGGVDLARDTRDIDGGANSTPDVVGIQAVFDGSAAASMGDLARMRWKRCVGRAPSGDMRLGVAAAADTVWPASLAPDMYDVCVGISRTEPAYAGREAVSEIRQLLVQAIANARQTLYLENGYFTAQAISEALSARLGAPQAPETVLITQQGAVGWLDETAMQGMRAQAHAQLQLHDINGRYHVFCPVQAQADIATPVRSKLMIADDELLCLGSANLNNRSMVLDTECQITVTAGDNIVVRKAIAAIRTRLIAMHLRREPETVERAVLTLGIAGAIQYLDPGKFALSPLSPAQDGGPAAQPGGLWVDRERPVSAERLIEQFMSDVAAPSRLYRLTVMAGIVAVAVLISALWRWTPLSNYLNLSMLMKMGYALKSLPYAPLAVMACYLLGGLLAVPITLLIAVCGLVFGAWLGGIYAIVGTMASALLTYGLGRWLGRDTVRRLAGQRINAISERIATRGIVAMVVLRVLPVAPFTVVNVMAGASHIRLRDYLIGTFLGMAPGIILMVAFARQLARVVQHPDLESVAIMVAAGLLLVGLAFGVQFFADALARTAGQDKAKPDSTLPV